MQRWVFYLHGGGGQVGALNVPWISQNIFLKHCVRVLMSFFLFLLWLRWRSHALGERCTSMLRNHHDLFLQTCMHSLLVYTIALFVCLSFYWHTSDLNQFIV